MMKLFLVLLGAALTAVAAAAQEVRQTAVLSLYVGDCQVWRQGKSQEAELGQSLHPGDSVLVDKDSRAEIAFGDGTVIRLGERSRFYIQSSDSSRSFRLAWGKFFAKVSKLTPNARFQVETPTAVAGVRGTVFRVEVSEDSSSNVAVEEGEVEVFNPRRRERMVRLSALRQALTRGDAGPSESGLDTLKMSRWERWSGAMFQNLYRSTQALLKGLGQTVKGHQRLREQAEKLLGKSSGIRDPEKMLQQAQDIERRLADGRRKFRLLRARLERRLHQAQALSGRMEDGSRQEQLAAKAAQLRTELDALVSRFEEADKWTSELLEQAQSGLESGAPQGNLNPGEVLRRLEALEAKGAQYLPLLEKIETDCNLIEPKLAEFIQKLLLIKSLYPDQPLLARQQFLLLRQDYFSFKAGFGGFDFPALDRMRPESRQLLIEGKRLIRLVPKDDPVLPRCKELNDRISSVTLKVMNTDRRTIKVARQAQILERIMLEIEGLIKS